MAMYNNDPIRVQNPYNPQQGGFPSLSRNPMAASIVAGDGQTQMPQQPKAWGKGGKAWQIIGVIGDALQKAGGGEGTFMPAFLDMQEQTRKERERLQQLQAQAQQEENERLARREDWVWQQQYGATHPSQTSEMQNFAWYKGMTPEDRAMYDQYKPVVINGPDGPYAVSRSGAEPQTAAHSSPSQVHIDALRQHPDQAAAFDAKFGPGAAASILGGGVSNGTGGFPY